MSSIGLRFAAVTSPASAIRKLRVAARAVNGHFAVSVSDTGPGIPEAQQARIFEQFHRVDSANTKARVALVWVSP